MDGNARPPHHDTHPGQEYRAGEPAPAFGSYETVNLFGRLTGHRLVLSRGETLPALPRGFTWRLITTEDRAG